VDAQVKVETDYLKECGVAPGVRGLGESDGTTPKQPKPEEVEKTFKESIASLAGVPQKEGK
jgi:hypothetical protein